MCNGIPFERSYAHEHGMLKLILLLYNDSSVTPSYSKPESFALGRFHSFNGIVSLV